MKEEDTLPEVAEAPSTERKIPHRGWALAVDRLDANPPGLHNISSAEAASHSQSRSRLSRRGGPAPAG